MFCGFFWALTYILIIKRGFQDKTYGVPLVALCANMSWEFTFSFIYPLQIPQLYISIIWFSLDVIVMFTLLRFGPREFPNMPRKLFYIATALVLATALCAVAFITHALGDWDGAYPGWACNLMTSIMFIRMLLRRKSLRGQSVYIALTKMLGSIMVFLPSVSSWPIATWPNIAAQAPIASFLAAATLTLDMTYVIMVYRISKRPLNPICF